MFQAALCPWCREPLSSENHIAETCPHCGKPLVDESGTELRPIDLRYERLGKELDRRLGVMLIRGTPIVLGLGLLLPLIHAAALVLLPAMALTHLILIRLYLQGVGRAYYGMARSFISRWITRLVFLWIGGPLYGLAILPILGGVISACCFAGLSWLVVHYEKRNLLREKERLPPAVWERALLIMLGILTLMLLLLLFTLAVLLGFSVQALVAWLQK